MAGSPAVTLLIVCVFCSCFAGLIYFVLWVTNTMCGSTIITDPSWQGMQCPAPAPAPADAMPSASTPAPAPAPAPSSNFPSGSIKLLNSETTFDGNNGDTPVANQPSGLTYDLQPVKFTISFRLNLTGDSTSWREILQNYTGSSWTNNAPDLAGNSPLIFVGPSDLSIWKNGLGFRMMMSDNTALEAHGRDNLLTVNQWYHITCVADTNKLQLYINGHMVNEATVPAGQTLRYRNTNNFVWNPNPYGAWTPVVMKDAYWWPRVLTTTEISQISSSATSTSTYAAEPLRGIEGYTWQ